MWAASWPCVWQFPGYERVDRKRAEPKPNTKHEWEQIKSKQRQSTNTFQQHLTKVFQPYADQILSHLTHTNVHVRPPTPYTHIYWNMALILAFISCSQQGERKPGEASHLTSSPFSTGRVPGTSFNCNCRNPLPECRLGGDHVQRRLPGVYLFKTLLKFYPLRF